MKIHKLPIQKARKRITNQKKAQGRKLRRKEINEAENSKIVGQINKTKALVI